MIPWERRVILKHYLDQRVPVTALAQQFGISWRAMHYWLSSGQLDAGSGGRAASLQSPFTAGLLARPLQATHPRPPGGVPSADGHPPLRGGKSGRLCGRHHATGRLRGRVRPQVEPEPLVRFETEPGHQAQVDFARFQFSWGVRYALLVVVLCGVPRGAHRGKTSPKAPEATVETALPSSAIAPVPCASSW